MKHQRINIVLSLVLMIVIGIGCGGSDAPEDKPVTTNKFPILGTVGQINADKTQFVLATLPENESLPPGQTLIELNTETIIVDNEGNTTTNIKNHDTVIITKGKINSSSITAKNITIKRSTEAPTYTLSEDSILGSTDKIGVFDIPTILSKQLGETLPKSFPTTSWSHSLPKAHPTIKGAKITELSNGDWKLFVLSNPETDELFSVTLTGTNDFAWTGFVDEDGGVRE
jgi:hypothetical protein